ncbi:MAG: glycosyltransferase [Bacilli bacterium]|nr:glycosyltransferase [Bacilli bacterium]
MKIIKRSKKTPKEYKFSIDHNPYEILSYNNTSLFGKAVVFPLFHYEGERQYLDLINPLLEKGYHLIIVKFLAKGDRVLFFNYYANVLSKLLNEMIQHKIIKNESIIFFGFGVGALLASYMQKSKLKGITKFILVSPVNRYKDEFMISREISSFKTPTYIFYGQNDSVTNIETRFAIFESGKNNPKVKFISYPICGHFLFYEGNLSLSVEEKYHKDDYDLFIGENRQSYIPDDARYNDKFYEHVFKILEDKPLPKRIALLTDVFPLFVNGVSTVVNLLKEELNKLGYETFIVALWDKKEPYDKLPIDYIPITGSRVHFVKGAKELHLLKSFSFQKNAKMLSLFGFDYLHLHTEYSMSQTALLLAKYTGINMVYTYHTLWKLYYEQKFGKLAGDVTYKAAKDLLFSRVYKECPTIIVPSLKSYEILKEDSSAKDIRIIPSSVDPERFKLTREDYEEIKLLKEKYQLKDKKVLGYIGRVSIEKNIEETLNNIAEIKDEIPNIIFMIVGAGDATKLLKKMVKKLKIENEVIFVGEVENHKLKYYYSLFDVFVTASNFETQGLTYFEAANCGTLILAKKDKAIEGVFEDGVNAYIYEDFYQWVERIEKSLFKNNKKITDAAKLTMKQFYPDKWAKKISNIYQELNPTKKK